MHIVSPCVRPKRVHKQEILFFVKGFACSKWAQQRQQHEQHNEPGDFWGTLGSVWGYFWYIKVHFQKTHTFSSLILMML